MKRTVTDVKTKSIECDGLAKAELIVTAKIKTEIYTEIVEGHGYHEIQEIETTIDLISIEVVIDGVGIDISKRLTKEQKSYLESEEIWEEN